MMRILYGIIFFFLLNTVFSQKDSITSALKNCASQDSALLLNRLAVAHRFSDPDKALNYAQLALKSATRNKNIKEMANATNAIGIQMHLLARYSLAMEHYLKAIKLFESIGEVRGVASANLNIGIIYADQKKTDQAKEYYLLAIDGYKKANFKSGLPNAYNNIATVFTSQKNHQKAIEYHTLALKIREELGDSAGIASSYNGLGVTYRDLKNYSAAIEMHKKSLAIEKNISDKRGQAISLNNLGDAYQLLGDFKNSEKCFLKGVAIGEADQNYYSLNDLYFNLVFLYEKSSDYKKALYFQKLYQVSNDSLFNIQSSDKVAEMESKYQNEKKQLEINNLNKDKEFQKLQLSAQQKENEAQNRLLLFGSIGLIAIAIFGFSAFINYSKAKKANLVIKNQNHSLELQNRKVEKQKRIIEEKQNEVLSSIRYARRIQQSLLPTEKYIDRILI